MAHSDGSIAEVIVGDPIQGEMMVYRQQFAAASVKLSQQYSLSLSRMHVCSYTLYDA